MPIYREKYDSEHLEKTEDEIWEELPSPQVYDNVVCESEETINIKVVLFLILFLKERI